MQGWQPSVDGSTAPALRNHHGIEAASAGSGPVVYEDLPDSQLRALEKLVGMSVLRWATTMQHGRRCNHYDVIDAAARVVGPVLLQRNPLRSDGRHYFHNHFVQRGLVE